MQHSSRSALKFEGYRKLLYYKIYAGAMSILPGAERARLGGFFNKQYYQVREANRPDFI